MGDAFRETAGEQIQSLEALLDKLPDAVARDLKAKIHELRKLLLEQRAPRLALIGRRGSGKSSLVNALFGEQVARVGHVEATTGQPEWYTVETTRGRMDLLDTRGLQEGSRPAEEDAAASPVDSVRHELRDKAPDVVLFLVKAKEVDAAIGGDLDLLEMISEDVEREHGFKPPLVAVLTHCDELEPKRARLHAPEVEDPTDIAEKLTHVRAAERRLTDHFKDREKLRGGFVRALGVCAYQSWRPDGSRRDDERWRIGELVTYAMEELPKEAQVEMARLTRVQAAQKKISGALTSLVASMTSGLAAVPIPVADIIPITSLQVSLVAGIGYIGGQEMSVKTAARFLGAIGVNLGAALGFREAARALVKFVFPGGGSLVSAGIAYAGTVAIGRAASAYFIDDATIEEARAAYSHERATAEKSAE